MSGFDTLPLTLNQIAAEGTRVWVYGTPLAHGAINLKATADLNIGEEDAPLRFARVRAYRIGADRWVDLSASIILAVPGEGEPLQWEECGFRPGEAQKWPLPIRGRTIGFVLSVGTVGDLLAAFASGGVEAGGRVGEREIRGGSGPQRCACLLEPDHQPQ